MKLKSIYRKDVVTVEATASLVEAAALMRERHVGAVVVVEGGQARPRPLGIITDRDIVVAVIGVPGARAETIRVGEVMPQRLVTIVETEGVFEALEAMARHGVRRLPVINASGALAGMVTGDDILRVLAAELESFAAALRRGAEREVATRKKLEI